VKLFALGCWSIAVAAAQVHSEPVSQTVIEERLHAFTTKNTTRELALRKLFEEAGCRGDALTEQSVKNNRSPNLVCESAGVASTIIVGAHYDLVEKGQGVVDNWSGAALLASLYQGLLKSSLRHTFVFVAFTGEETGLVGSKAFVKQLGHSASQVKAMVNLDTLGLSGTKVWTSRADARTFRLPSIPASAGERVSCRALRLLAVNKHSFAM
jgi:hypothetical protein